MSDTVTEITKIKGSADLRTALREQKDEWKKAFIAMNDPTGYAFSQEYVEGGYLNWKAMRNSSVAKDELAEWVEELEVKLQSQGIQCMAGKDTFEASKWLADRGWVPKEDKRTKEGKKRAEREAKAVEEDLARIGIVRDPTQQQRKIAPH